MKEDKIVLPKSRDGLPCLSYSQISTWKKNKRDYIRQYFFGEKFTGNDYTKFGSLIGESLEKGDFSKFTAKEQELLNQIPRYDQFEKYISLKFKGFHVIGYIDTNTSDFLSLADYKTGEVKQEKIDEYQSDDYIQLDIYSAAILQEHKVLPNNVQVVLIDRTGNAFKNEPLKLGDKIHTITKKVTKARIKEVMKDIEAVAKDISDHYKIFLELQKHISYVKE